MVPPPIVLRVGTPGCTVTCSVLLPTHPKLDVPVILYIVVTVGLMFNVLDVKFPCVAEYEEAPLKIKEVDEPRQILVLPMTLREGTGWILNMTMLIAVQFAE